MPDDTGVVRITLVLRRPRLPWHPRPTVVIDGRGQPAQWGTGTWQVRPGTTIAVYLYNRVWRYGQAGLVVPSAQPATIDYRAPVLPLGSGKIADEI